MGCTRSSQRVFHRFARRIQDLFKCGAELKCRSTRQTVRWPIRQEPWIGLIMARNNLNTPGRIAWQVLVRKLTVDTVIKTGK